MSRTDFEAAYIERYGHRPRGWNDDFQVYQDAHANGAWFGWQAGAAGIEAKAAPVGEREAFESIAADDNFGILRVLGEMAEQHGLEDGDYIELAARHAWGYFQAGAAYQRQSGVNELPPFAQKVISKLQRFQECAEDGEDTDIGRHWLDLLTQLALLNRVQRSPALWEISQQGEDVLDSLNGAGSHE